MSLTKAVDLLGWDKKILDNITVINNTFANSQITDYVWSCVNSMYKLPKGFLKNHCTADLSIKADQDLLPLWPILPGPFTKPGSTLLKRPKSTEIFVRKYPEKVKIYESVRAGGAPNYRGSRQTLDTILPLDSWKYRLRYYEDFDVVTYLEFGWPASFDTDEMPMLGVKNHSSAVKFPTAIEAYLEKEMKHKALLGPFDSSPLEWLRANPMMSREKKGTTERRVILDLSYPEGSAVNTFIPKTLFDGGPYKLKLPTAIDFANIIAGSGKSCWLTKIDLSRAYRQLPMDPWDWPLLGLDWENGTFVDTAVPFGLRHGAMYCERVTQAICFLAKVELLLIAIAYIDDIASANKLSYEEARNKFEKMKEIVRSLGLTLAGRKCQGPSLFMVWIGVYFNSETMTMAIDEEKIKETLLVCSLLLEHEMMPQEHLDSLVGKLIHCTKFIPCGRRFLNRILQLKRENWDKQEVELTEEAKKDLRWFIHYLERFNGISMIRSFVVATHVIESDACMSGGGAIWKNERFFSVSWSADIMDWKLAISELELFTVLLSLRMWKEGLKGITVKALCDNRSSVDCINFGKAKNVFMANCIRELWLICTINDIHLICEHIAGVNNNTADLLSRASLSSENWQKYRTFKEDSRLPEDRIHKDLLFFPDRF